MLTGRWSLEEVEFLLNNHKKMKARDIAIKLNRSVSSVYAQVQNLYNKKDKIEIIEKLTYSNSRLSYLMNKKPIYNIEMSLKTGMSPDEIAAIRKGEKIPKVNEALKIAQVLSCSIADFAIIEVSV